MALVTPYCTVSEANTYLVGSSAWADANTTQKNSALFWGRIHLDSKYSCVAFDEDDPPDEVKYANALLAEDYLQGTLLDDGTDVNGRIKLKRSKAGSVETETEYLGGASVNNYQDDVNQLLHGICTKTGSSTRIIRT